MRAHPSLFRFFFFAMFTIPFFGVASARAQENLKYQVPPKGIVALVDVLPTPSVTLSPAGASDAPRWLLIQDLSGLPPISDLAQPELRLAGLRFNPRTNGPSRGRYATAIKLKQLPDGMEISVTGLPPNAKIRSARWSSDQTMVAVVNESDSKDDAGLSLWIVDVASARARHVPGIALDGIFGAPCEWRSNTPSLICKTVVANRGPAPVRSEIPEGPVIQENLGRVTPGSTYEDLLKDPEDENIFDYYATSRIALIQSDGSTRLLGKPGVISDAVPSPDGNFVLVTEHHRPYSYLLPVESFPERVSVVSVNDGTAKQLTDKPLQDNIPNIHDAVPPGPREYQWRADVSATIAWAEAGDGGDPRKEAAVRDTLFTSDAPFDGNARKLVELPVRFTTVAWTENHIALVQGRRWKDRKRIILAVGPSAGAAPIKLFDGSFEDRYNDPGQPLEITNNFGQQIATTTTDHSAVYFRGEGSSAEGDIPFVSTMSLTNGDAKKVWRSEKPFYEVPWAIIDRAALAILVRRESPQQSPNFYVWKPDSKTLAQITSFPSPYGDAVIPTKHILKYTRPDGVELSANLYLPPGYKKEDGPLPTLIEAYPTEYKTKSSAGQITGSPYQFVFLYWGSPVPFVTQGYAVLENASIPIIGEGNAEPNDTYVEQLVTSAQAAIDEGVRLGVVDRNRVAVMGHSYGAFMTVNLLAHSNLFKAGIARSGAYNRTLTPFGFQNEDRTYWQAPDVYNKMSPFMHADYIKTPLLLIHGEADNNSGTFPIQSERLFSALKGQGATVRFVLLPLEAHGYTARESVLDMFWEMNTWMNTYVKNPPQASAATQAANH